MAIDLVFIGLGGTGSRVPEPLLRFLVASGEADVRAGLWDPDRYSLDAHDRARQPFWRPGVFKVAAVADFLSSTLPEVKVSARAARIDRHSVDEALPDEPRDRPLYCILCPDNDRTRKVVDDRVARMRYPICLIAAGNELLTGGLQIVTRADHALTPPLSIHPNIDRPRDRLPARRPAAGCEQAIRDGQSQTVFANLLSAALVCGAFYEAYTRWPEVRYNVAYFDLDGRLAVRSDAFDLA